MKRLDRVCGAVSIAFLSVLSSGAATNDFPNADGSFDLSSAAAWGETLPAETDTIRFNKSYGQTLTISKDVTFDSIFFTKANSSNTVEVVDPNVTVTLKSELNTNPGIRPHGSESAQLVLKGGTYDLCGKGGIYGSSPADSSGSTSDRYCKLTLDGVTVTNAADIAAASARNVSGNKLTLANGTCVYAKKADKFINATYYKTGASAVVSGGSKLIITDGAFNPFINYITGASLLVTGAGSIISNASTKSDALFYNNPQNCTIRVEDHGEINFRPGSVCYAGGANNQFIVSGGGILRFLNGVSFAYSGGATTKLKVLEDGLFEVKGTLTLQKYENEIVVSNGTFKGTLSFGGDRNTVRVLGPKAKGPDFSTMFNGGAIRSLLEFGDGAVYTTTGYIYGGGGDACSNTVAVVDGATMTVGHFPGISYTAGHSLFGNTFRIANGGSFISNGTGGGYGQFCMTGWDNQVIVSNGTLSAVNGIVIGGANLDKGSDEEKKDLANTGNKLILQGTCPRVTSPTTSQIMRGGVLRFEVPAGGYPADTLPLVEVFSLQNGKGDQMKLEVAGVDEDFVKNLENRFDVTLVKQTKRPYAATLQILAAQVEAINATLPDRARLYLTPDNYELHLSAKPPRGAVLIVR